MTHATKISVRTWVMVIFEMCSSKNGVAAREIERKYDICPRTAWHMLHRIREAMSHDNASLFSGNVVADEVYIGGNPEFVHANKHHGRVGLKGTHIHVDAKHLHRYLGEFDYRFSTCDMTDAVAHPPIKSPI